MYWKALHCGPRNNGKYDAMYTLTPEWHEQLSEFIGLSNTLPSDQLVTRSVTGKASTLSVNRSYGF